jgi:hypothetical protein
MGEGGGGRAFFPLTRGHEDGGAINLVQLTLNQKN